jgi:hypothetical protein
MQKNPAADKILLGLLEQAAAAHGVHEQEELGGVYDEAWPEWYAAHMARALAEQGYRLVPAADAPATDAPTPDAQEGDGHEPL